MKKVTKLHGLAVWAFEECMKIEKATGADVFFSYSPHVRNIRITVHINGWNKEHGPEITHDFYVEESFDEDGTINMDCDDCLIGMCWFDEAIYNIELKRFELECERRRQTKQDKLDQIAKLQKELEEMGSE